jgi:hypothetical protein
MSTGNVTLTNVLAQPFQWGASTTIVTSVFIVLSIAILSAVVRRPSSDPKIHKLQGFDFLTAWSFFSKQYDFLRNNFEKTGLKMFSFQILEVSAYMLLKISKTSTDVDLYIASRDCDVWRGKPEDNVQRSRS